MHTLSFEVTRADVAALNHFFLTSTRQGQSLRALMAFLAGGVPVAFWARTPLSIALFLNIGVFVWLLFPRAYARLAASQADATAKTPHGGGLLCTHTLALTEDALIETTPVTSQSTAWSLVRGIHIGPKHAFVFLNPQLAHVIPRERVSEGSYEAFLQEAVRLFEARRI